MVLGYFPAAPKSPKQVLCIYLKPSYVYTVDLTVGIAKGRWRDVSGESQPRQLHLGRWACGTRLFARSLPSALAAWPPEYGIILLLIQILHHPST